MWFGLPTGLVGGSVTAYTSVVGGDADRLLRAARLKGLEKISAQRRRRQHAGSTSLPAPAAARFPERVLSSHLRSGRWRRSALADPRPETWCCPDRERPAVKAIESALVSSGRSLARQVRFSLRVEDIAAAAAPKHPAEGGREAKRKYSLNARPAYNS